MEKRGRGMKAPGTPVAQQSPTGHRRERRASMFEKEAYTQILKERLKESSHDVLYVEPPFDDSIAEINKEWKSSMAKFRFANTYRMEPMRKFQAHSVGTKVQQILTSFKVDQPLSINETKIGFRHIPSVTADLSYLFGTKHRFNLDTLKEVKYDDKLFSRLSLELSDLILSAVKDFAYQRYKLIIKVASRWIWDAAWDTWVAAKHETETYVALALVFGLYCE